MAKLIVVIFCSFVIAKATTVVKLNAKTSETNPSTVSCEMKQINSTSGISWNYTDPDSNVRVLGIGEVMLNITALSGVGTYSCISDNAVINSVDVVYIANPTIQNTRKSVTFNDGDKKRKLTCTSEGSYPTVTFEWSRRGESENEASIIITDKTDPNINITFSGNNSTMLFHNLTYSMQAYYACEVKNIAGNSTVEVLVRVKDRLAALWPFLGIVAEVVILITIILLYEKHSKKTTLVEVDMANEDEKPLNRRDDGMEMRNRQPNNNYK